MLKIANKQKTQQIIKKYNLRALKKYGQNFLIDERIINEIVTIAKVTKQTAVIEIGPGIGALTEALSQAAAHVYAYEIDPRLEEILKDTLKEKDNITLVIRDFLKVDLNGLVEDLSAQYEDICIVSNLPYYITTKLITRFVKGSEKISRIVVMLQQEVADKLIHQAGPLKMMIDYTGTLTYELDVPRHVYIPAPHVDSAIITITHQRAIDDELAALIEAAFTQKRKTINNNLKPLLQEHTTEIFNACGISPDTRAQDMHVDDFVRILKEKKRYENQSEREG